METITLTDDQFKEIQRLLELDIEQLASERQYFEENNLVPKDYIDKMITLCKLFKVDFWESAELYLAHYPFYRLKAQYNGMSGQKFDENYQEPTDGENAKHFLRPYLRRWKKD